MIIDNLKKFVEEATNDAEEINSSDEISDNDLIDLSGYFPASDEVLEPLSGEMEPDSSPFDIIDESNCVFIEREKPETIYETVIDVPQDVLFEGYISKEGLCFKSEEYFLSDLAPKIIKMQFNDLYSQIVDGFIDDRRLTKAEWLLMKVLGYAKVEKLKDGNKPRLRLSACYQLKEEQYDAVNPDDPTIWAAKKLYAALQNDSYNSYPFEKKSLGEGMSIISQSMYGHWKQQYLIDNIAKKAYLIIDADRVFKILSPDDIDWDSLGELSQTMKDRAKNLYANFPYHIGSYEDGKSLVSWQINPDGRYFMDEDGYGMTDDEEITLVGYIDRRGRAVGKFSLSK